MDFARLQAEAVAVLQDIYLDADVPANVRTKAAELVLGFATKAVQLHEEAAEKAEEADRKQGIGTDGSDEEQLAALMKMLSGLSPSEASPEPPPADPCPPAKSESPAD